jgi:hypothetical protein
MEHIDHNLLFRWFVGFSLDDKVWDHPVFSRNRDRLLEAELSHRFFAKVLSQAEKADLLSKEHFSVDGTLIEALASHKSYRPKDEDGPPVGGGRNPTVDFHGEKRDRDTHESKTDKDACLFKKTQGAESKLAYLGHILMENRHGLLFGWRKGVAGHGHGRTGCRRPTCGCARRGGNGSRWAQTRAMTPGLCGGHA